MNTMKMFVITIIVMFLSFGCSNYQSDESANAQKSTESESGFSSKEPAPAQYDALEEIVLPEEMSEKKSTGRATSQTAQGIDYSKIISSSAATEANISELRKIIRRAEVKFRTGNVPETTYNIERLVGIHGGWVSQTNLFTEQLSENRIKVSEDSTLIISRYVVRNSMIIRVPFKSLDTVLLSLVPFIEHLDYRIINAEDVTFQIFAEKLKQKRLSEYNQRMKKHTASGTSKLSDITEAEKQILLQQERADAAYIEEMKLNDNILFSSIYLDIYEKETFEKILVPDPEEIRHFKPGFGQRLVKAMKAGWIIIQEIVLAVVHLWGIIAIGIGLFFLIRYITKRFSRAKSKKS
jgi:hypothetical protein